jgi:hypothetical protein
MTEMTFHFSLALNNLDDFYVSFLISPKTTSMKNKLNLSEIALIFTKEYPLEFKIILTRQSLSESRFILELIHKFECSMDDTGYFCAPNKDNYCYTFSSIDYQMSRTNLNTLLIRFLSAVELQSNAQTPWIQDEFSVLFNKFATSVPHYASLIRTT